MVTVRIPAPSATAVTNLLGALGLLGLIVALGALTSWPWALGLASLFAVGLSVLAQTRTAAAQAVQDAPTRELRRVS